MNASEQSILERLKDYINRGKQVANETAIFFVANIKDKTRPSEDYSETSIVSEFYTLDEADDILNGFRESGFLTTLFIDEDSFIKWIHENNHSNIKKKYKFVYFTAQNGIGPARRSLLASFCSLHSLKMLNSDAHVCSMTRHKFHLFSVLNKYGVNCGKFWMYHPQYGWMYEAPPKGKSVIAKPIYESCCIGVSKDSHFNYDIEHDAYIQNKSRIYKQPIMIQEFISGYEVEIPVFGMDRACAPFLIGTRVDGQEFMGNNFLTYERVFEDDYEYYQFNKGSNSERKKILEATQKAFEITGMQGICRFDVRVDHNHMYTIIDATSHPHLTRHSSNKYLFELVGHSYQDMFAFLIGLFI